MDISEIIRQHGNSVAVVFKNRGIKAAPTVNNLMLQTILYGDDFINDVANQVDDDYLYTNVEGDEIVPSPDFKTNLFNMFQANLKAGNTTPTPVYKSLQNVTVKAKPEKGAKIKKTLGDILSVVGSGLGAYIGAKKSVATQPFHNAGDPPTPEKKKQNYFLIGGIVLIVILIAAVLMQKNK